MKLYEFLQHTLQTHATYQQLISMEQTPNAMLNGNFDLLPSYTPDDPDGAVRKRFMQKIAARYYNYDLFTVDPNYFGQRMFWKLNTIMPTFQAKFNAVISPAEFEQAFLNGVTHEAEGSRDNSGTSRSTSTGTASGTSSNTSQSSSEDSSFGSDYPQVAVASGMDYNTTASQSKGNTTGTSSGSTSSTSENGTDSTSQTTEGWKEKRTRKLTPDEILLAKQKISKLIINIEEEIAMNCSDLFQNVFDCCDPCEDREKNMVTKMQIELNNKLNAYAQQAADLEVAQTAELIATQNGVVTPVSPYVGFSKVTVQVPPPALEEKHVEITSNGRTVVEPAEGFDGLTRAVITVDVPGGNDIIDVDELPDTDIDTSKYYRVDGKLYQYRLADPDADEVKGVWVFNEQKLNDFGKTLAWTTGGVYDIVFGLEDDTTYRRILFTDVAAVETIGKAMLFIRGDETDTAAKYRNDVFNWTADKFKTINVSRVVGSTPLAFLQQVADKQAAFKWFELIAPVGELEIRSNGTADVTAYASVTVDVPETELTLLEVSANGSYVPDEGTGYGAVNVNVPIPDGYVKPEGTKEIMSNGEVDVTNYASVNVNVASSGGSELLTASTPEEMEALLTAENVNKFVQYTGESMSNTSYGNAMSGYTICQIRESKES